MTLSVEELIRSKIKDKLQSISLLIKEIEGRNDPETIKGLIECSKDSIEYLKNYQAPLNQFSEDND